MQVDWPQTLGVALALLAVGALLGELWARLRTPRSDGRVRGGRPHYLLGLNYLVSNQSSHAIRELSQAVRQETDAVEAYLALGNLFRENGQSERAIDIHKSLLHRPALSAWERTQVLLSLAMDFKKAGLIDRAERIFNEVALREPENLGSLRGLQTIAEETGRWEEALRIHRRLQAVSNGTEENLLPALETAWGQALVDSDAAAAAAHFRAALELRPDYGPAHVGLGLCILHDGDPAAAVEHLEQAIDGGGPWAQAALEPLAETCVRLGESAPLQRACDAVLAREPHSWRAHLAVAALQRHRGEFDAARQSLRLALVERPGSLAVQRQLWDLMRVEGGGGVDGFAALLDEAIGETRLLDPFVCMRCRFKSAKLAARCPHCHQWNTMAEERFE